MKPYNREMLSIKGSTKKIQEQKNKHKINTLW